MSGIGIFSQPEWDESAYWGRYVPFNRCLSSRRAIFPPKRYQVDRAPVAMVPFGGKGHNVRALGFLSLGLSSAIAVSMSEIGDVSPIKQSSTHRYVPFSKKRAALEVPPPRPLLPPSAASRRLRRCTTAETFSGIEGTWQTRSDGCKCW